MIPFNRPWLSGNELAYLADAVRQGHVSADGAYTRRCHALLEELLSTPRALLTTSCTDALELCALLLEIGPDDEVIVPSFSFVSTANAFALRGARTVFADVRPDTLNVDAPLLAPWIGPRTRAIVVVHYAGVACEMDEILALASRDGIAVIEDNAHGFLARYRGRRLGTIGRLATLSFHETKNFTCGEGGALLVNEPALVERAEILRDKGTNRGRFLRGQVDKYTWTDLGSSFAPSDLLAAFLLAQLENRDEIQRRRQALWQCYADGLADWAHRHSVGMPVVPPHCEPSYHLFYMLLPTPEDRSELMATLRAAEIAALFHYTPLHLSAMGRRHGGRPGACPTTEDISERLVRLPLYNDLSWEHQERVIDVVRSFLPHSSRA